MIIFESLLPVLSGIFKLFVFRSKMNGYLLVMLWIVFSSVVFLFNWILLLYFFFILGFFCYILFQWSYTPIFLVVASMLHKNCCNLFKKLQKLILDHKSCCNIFKKLQKLILDHKSCQYLSSSCRGGHSLRSNL